MNNISHAFVTVDMRGLKVALVARARSNRVSVSALVRAAVARDLKLTDAAEPPQTAIEVGTASRANIVKLSIRFTADEAGQMVAGARAARLSRGAYLAGPISSRR